MKPVEAWVESAARETRPDKIQWCDGSDGEYAQLSARMLASGELMALDPASYPGCYLHRSHPSDVARTEHVTFVCPDNKEDAGPNNNWMAPAEAKTKLTELF